MWQCPYKKEIITNKWGGGGGGGGRARGRRGWWGGGVMLTNISAYVRGLLKKDGEEVDTLLCQ